MGILIKKFTPHFHFYFLLILGRSSFGGPEEKTTGPHYYSLSFSYPFSLLFPLPFFHPPKIISTKYTLRLHLFSLLIKRMENREDKIGEIFCGKGVLLEWFWGRENGGGWLFSPLAHKFSTPQIKEKMRKRIGWMKITHLTLPLPKGNSC